jgi:hypothetical protein
MRIAIITPVRASSRSGNGTTTGRWTRILRRLGHEVRVANCYNALKADLMIALHAWRSADSIRDFRERYPDRPLIVALSGTDIYDYIDRDPAPTLHSLASPIASSRCRTWRDGAGAISAKGSRCYQSAPPPHRSRGRRARSTWR